MGEEMDEANYFAHLLQHRQIHGGVPNTAASLYDQCILSTFDYAIGENLPMHSWLDYPSLRKIYLYLTLFNTN